MRPIDMKPLLLFSIRVTGKRVSTLRVKDLC